MTKSPRLIAFDWNGTLLDDFGAVLAAFDTVFRQFGLPVTPEDVFRSRYETPFSVLFQNHGLPAVEAARVADACKPLFHASYEAQAAKTDLRAGTRDVLQQAKDADIACVIISNHIVPEIEKHLTRLDIRHYFTAVLAFPTQAAQFTSSKGDMLKTYLAGQRDRAVNGMIVGDAPEEIRIGKALELTTVAITGGFAAEEKLLAERPVHLVHSLAELRPLLAPEVAA